MSSRRPELPVAEQPGPERLISSAISRIAVEAYRRGIHLSTDVDCRLPDRLDIDSQALGAALRLGLLRGMEAGGARGFGLAIWRDDDGTPAALIEISRAEAANARPRAGLADIWAAAFAEEIGEAVPPMQSLQRGDGTETVLIRLPAPLPPHGPAAPGPLRRALVVRDLLVDPERCRRSLAALGLDATFAGSAAAAFDAARKAAAAGRPLEHMVLDARLLGADAAVLAGGLRGDPRLAGTRITLVTDAAAPDADAPDRSSSRYHAVIRLPLPWRRLSDGLAGILPQGPGARPADRTGTGARVPDLTGRRILVAEDTATNQVLLRALLAPTGAETATVADGRAAIAEHANRPASLILMDLKMPGMGGVAAARQIRAVEADGRRVPIVALTAHALPADRRRAAEAGMDAYLVKPIVVAEFYDLIARLLGVEGRKGP